MDFKHQVCKDIGKVFLNIEEFADYHRIEGKMVAAVFDDEQLQKMKQGQMLGLVEADVLIFARQKDLPPHITPGSLLNVDGRELLVVDAAFDMGMAEIALKQNRSV